MSDRQSQISRMTSPVFETFYRMIAGQINTQAGITAGLCNDTFVQTYQCSEWFIGGTWRIQIP